MSLKISDSQTVLKKYVFTENFKNDINLAPNDIYVDTLLRFTKVQSLMKI